VVITVPGVILVISQSPRFAVKTLPTESTVSPYGLSPVTPPPNWAVVERPPAVMRVTVLLRPWAKK